MRTGPRRKTPSGAFAWPRSWPNACAGFRGEDTERPAETREQRRSKLRRDRDAARRTGSFLIHIHAPWGAGKSSLLNFLSTELRNVDACSPLRPRRAADPRLSQWIVAEFSAWEHQRLEPPWWWLLAAIRRSAGNAPEMQAELEDLLSEFAPLLENNPRAMKRLVNAYGIERDRLLREHSLPSQQQRKQLVLFTILRLRWPQFAEHLLGEPQQVRMLAEGQFQPDATHPFLALFSDGDVRQLFADNHVGVRLDADIFARYAGREIDPQAPVSA